MPAVLRQHQKDDAGGAGKAPGLPGITSMLGALASHVSRSHAENQVREREVQPYGLPYGDHRGDTRVQQWRRCPENVATLRHRTAGSVRGFCVTSRPLLHEARGPLIMKRRSFLTLALACWAKHTSGQTSASRLRVGVIGHTGRGNYGYGLKHRLDAAGRRRSVAVADANAAGLAEACAPLRGSRGFGDDREMLGQV